MSDGQAIPGTHWVRLGPTAVKTKGGRVFEFAASGKLQGVRWGSQSGVALAYTTTTIASSERVTRIDSCVWTGPCTVVFSISYDAAGRVRSVLDRATLLAMPAMSLRP